MSNLMLRTYLVCGLDRKLYRAPPQWPEGTFQQDSDDEGRLILRVTDLRSTAERDEARGRCDCIAERFRLAIARRIERPLTIFLLDSSEPSFETDLTQVKASFSVRVSAEAEILPRDPPHKIEQLPEAGARWVLTLTEASNFGVYPDEVLKRLYLLIEELKEQYADALTPEQRGVVNDVRRLRDFVSHPVCTHSLVVEFVGKHLPDAVDGSVVRFDRTKVEHRNFVGRYDPVARGIANTLLDAAINALWSSGPC